MRYLDSIPLPALAVLASRAERKSADCRRRSDGKKATRLSRLARRLQRKWEERVRASRRCPNPDCRGGFVGGEDPHACGDC